MAMGGEVFGKPFIGMEGEKLNSDQYFKEEILPPDSMWM